jgi:hypothetical protein
VKTTVNSKRCKARAACLSLAEQDRGASLQVNDTRVQVISFNNKRATATSLHIAATCSAMQPLAPGAVCDSW